LRPELLDYVRNLPASSHVLFLYESEEDKRTVLFTYVQDRIRRGELVSYCVHVDGVWEIEQAMRDFGVDVDMGKRKGLLEVFKFDPKIVEATIKIPAREILKGIYEAKGRRTMSLISDNSLPAWTPEKLLECERSHGRRMEVPVTFICAYPSSEICKIWNGEYVMEMLKTHGHGIFPGIALPLG